MSDQVSLGEQKAILPEEDQKIVPEEILEEEKIAIADDVLRKFLEWILLEDLPKITLTSRRLWVFGDEQLEGRKHAILFMDVQTNPDRLTVNGRVVPFTEVEPPTEFRLRRVTEVDTRIGEQALEFLQVSKTLFLHATLSVCWDSIDANTVGKFSDFFDNCVQIIFTSASASLTKKLFEKEAITNCYSLYIHLSAVVFVCTPGTSFNVIYPSFNPNSVFNWLHSPSPTAGPVTAKRQIRFNSSTGSFTDVPTFVYRLRKKFLEDGEKRKFVTRFHRGDLQNVERIQEENLWTGEVMFMRDGRDIEGVWRELVRCAKGEEESVTYEHISCTDHPFIRIH